MAPARLIERLPWLLLLAVGGLLMLGWLGIARVEQLGGSSGSFLRRQLVWSAAALAAGMLTAAVNYRVLLRWSYAGLGLSIVLLSLVYLWPPINGAHRWMRLGPIGFQPSEIAKLAFVAALARYLMYRDNQRHLAGLLLPLAIMAVPLLLILREPDLGTALVLPPVLLAMLTAAGARMRDVATVVLTGLVMTPLLWTQMSGEQRSRVTSLLNQAPAGERPRDEGYHLYQSKQMIALGGVTGSLLGGQRVEDEAAYHLPESHSDFVFSVLGERLGVLGLAVVLALYAVLIWRGLCIASECREPFGRLAAVGVVTILGVQAVINTGMTVGLLPITGLSLPLMSYGGSGLLTCGAAIGLLVNIAIRPGYELAGEPFQFSTIKKKGRRAKMTTSLT